MSPELAVQLIGDAVVTIIKILLVVITPGLVVGIVVAIIQTATSVQEQTLTFLPRMLATLLVLIFAGHWMLETLTDWFARLAQLIPGVFG
ncbi:flagellar biosynthetic protein FliQ [Shewanella dokdonensis]|uniref:Flagellar biosynthetic protein FliQ n=1 Tax=Shewanella dokdonensis TaxID=712036 RepID=A0ABX8DDD0_9GAMM|nr:flagellar biosynthetic protein FliQ [Shewanella dokdonensis]MCL1073456.1 flagellar biosynthetic protein FliQ [Shewanella dokdonensis]QVK22749.1 flagellar biosynthetic protein FliQ [Shewanella dokdonensis]